MDFSRFLGLYKNFINRLFSGDEESRANERKKLLDSLKWVEAQRKDREHSWGDYSWRNPIDNTEIEFKDGAGSLIPNDLITIPDGKEKA